MAGMEEGREPVAGQLPRLVREPQPLHPRLAAQDPGHLRVEPLDPGGIEGRGPDAHIGPLPSEAASARAATAPRSANWLQRPV